MNIYGTLTERNKHLHFKQEAFVKVFVCVNKRQTRGTDNTKEGMKKSMHESEKKTVQTFS